MTRDTLTRRRTAGRCTLWLAVGLCLAGNAAGQARSDLPGARARPNIVVIMADDMGFSDVGAYGGEIRTPHLDRLAETGLRFTQFYNTSRCSPTRASLLTGLYPHQAGMGHMPDAYARSVRETFDSPGYTDHLAYHTPTIAEVLRGAGYATYMAGKWHIGYDRPQWPVDRGFDRSFTVLEGAMNYYGHGMQHTGEIADPPMAVDDRVYLPPREGFFATDAWTDHAVRFIREHDGEKPFFLYLAHTAPHWPLHAPAEDIERYRGKYMGGWDRLRRQRYARMVELGLIDPRWPLAPRPEGVPAWSTVPADQREVWDHEMAVYAAQVERMDAGIGRVLEAVREAGAAENTLVIFLSDNGGAAEDPNRSLEGSTLGDRDSYEGYGIRGAHASSAPFRLTKKYIHEGGIASPFIVHWPAAVRARGELRHQPAHVIDLLPTLMHAAGASLPGSHNGHPTTPLEGVSLLPAFAGRPLPERTLFWEHQGNRGVRRGRWKLVARFPGPWELYDMEADRTELNDLAARLPAVAAELAAAYDAYARRTLVGDWAEVEKRRGSR